MMKKTLFALALMMMGTAAFAQSKLDVGLRFTPLISGVRNVDTTKTVVTNDGRKSRLGYNVGLMVNYNFTENFGFHTGLGYVNYGYSTENSLLKVKTTYNAVEIPTALRLRTPEIAGKPIHIRLLAGVNHYILVGATTTTTPAGGTPDVKKNTDNMSVYHAGILAGLGADWKIEKVGLFDFGFRMNRGISDLATNNGKAKSSMNYYGIDLGYYFNW